MFKFQLNIAEEEIEIITKPIKAAKDIKKKTKNISLEDMRKLWKEKPLHGKYTLGTDTADVDRVTTHQRLSSSSLKGDTRLYTRSSRPKCIYTSIPIKNP